MITRPLLGITGRLSLILLFLFAFSACEKSIPEDGINLPPYYDLDATLLPVTSKMDHGTHSAGLIKFRQNPDTARIITLTTSVYNLKPRHAYLLQRAVDLITTSTCISTGWLTLGKGLVPQALHTDFSGNGEEEFFRDVTSVARGSQFHIHFQIVDSVTLTAVLASDCYQYTVR